MEYTGTKEKMQNKEPVKCKFSMLKPLCEFW